MFRIVALIVLSSLSCLNVLADTETSKFDSIYVHAATHLAGSDVSRAIEVADSLINNTAEVRNLMKSYMLLATLKSQVGKPAEALSNALKARKIAEVKDFTDWKVRISGFLSTTFRSVNLIEEAKKHLDEAEQTHRKIDSASPAYFLIKSFLHQEKALYYLNEKNFVKTIEEIDHSEQALKSVPEKQIMPTFQALNFQLRGGSYMGLEEWDHAEQAFELGLEELKGQETELQGFIYVGLAQVALFKHNLESALTFLKKSEGYIKSSDNFKLKSSLFKAFSEYYQKAGDTEKALAYNQSYLNVMEESAALTSDIANHLLQELYIVKDTNTKSIRLLIIGSIILIFLILFVVLWSYFNRKKDKARYDEIVKKLKEKKERSIHMHKEPNSTGNIARAKANTLNMSKETESRLLMKLEKMEEGTLFLDPTITLSALSTALETNPKYLSYIINTYKGKDFSNYINQLRIEYAIMKLNTDPIYRQYKLAVIADECGFSSHSKFTSVFKSIHGISPSVFISHLKKDKMQA